MSKAIRGPGRPYGVPDTPGATAPVKGSVRAARERLLEVQRAVENGPPELRQQALRDGRLASQFASSRRTQEQEAKPLDVSSGQPSTPKWPFYIDSYNSLPMYSVYP